MTVEYSTNFNLVLVKNELPSAGDWAATYWNWKVADALLYNAAVAHKHDNKPALANPTGYLTLTTSDTGGTLPAGTTYYFVATYLDAMGRETGKSAQAAITTALPISPPNRPTYTQATDLVAKASALTGGIYGYKLSYVKGGGETTCSEAVYATVPTDQTYSVTIHFDSLNDVGNGADKIIVYRKINNGGWNKLIEITSLSRDYYTDDNTAVPTCDVGPKTANTTNAFNTITIDWSTLTNYTDAEYIKLYVSTTTDGAATPTAKWTSANMLLLNPIPLNAATIPTQHTWTGTTLLPGAPPAVSQSLPSPSKIDLETEVQGNLPWANLPDDFVWLQPVDTYTELGTGTISGEIRLVLDTMTLYAWNDELATPTWERISGGGISVVTIPVENKYDPPENYLPTENIQDGDVCIVKSEEDNETGGGKYLAIYMYQEHMATPAWIHILGLLPTLTSWSTHYNNVAQTGDFWLQQDSYGRFLLFVAEEDHNEYLYLNQTALRSSLGLIGGYYYTKQELIDDGWWYYYEGEEFVEGANSINTYDGLLTYCITPQAFYQWLDTEEDWVKIPASHYRGVYTTVADLDNIEEPENNDIAYVLQDDSATPCERWYIYDNGWKAAGVRATGQHIAAISTDMSADAEENELKGKINEIIARLQDAGVIV